MSANIGKKFIEVTFKDIEILDAVRSNILSWNISELKDSFFYAVFLGMKKGKGEIPGDSLDYLYVVYGFLRDLAQIIHDFKDQKETAYIDKSLSEKSDIIKKMVEGSVGND
jgi:hypothetical protein